MNRCVEIHPPLLEAEPTALAGQGDDPVAVHVRSCPACAARARVVLEETAALDRLLAQPATLPDVDAILRAAGVPDAHGDGDGTSGPTPVLRFPSWRRWSTLAAAAAVAGLLFFRGQSPLPQAPIPQPTAAPPLVEAAPGQNVAVLATDNPDITVVWFF